MDPLSGYRAKRDFTVTPEPDAGGTPGAGSGDVFVVQRHRAQRLHYDLRLEVDGVLVSWSVPRGPTLDPAVRRLAVRTEDHPLEYATFEGVIPRGEYGAGDVVVWDLGRWRCVGAGDAGSQIDDGTVHVELHGRRLRGRFVLTRTGRRSGSSEQWLLLKKDDEHAVVGWDPEDHPTSVLSGRTNEQVRVPASAPPRAPAPAVVPHSVASEELDELDGLASGDRWHVDGVEVSVSNPDKILFPATQYSPVVTKRDLIRHYVTMAPHVLVYLQGRAVNLQRFPDGVERPGFWQKNVPSNAPEWLGRWHDPAAKPGRTEWYSVLDRPAALAWMANLAVVELHPWTSRVEAPDRPTWALIDIDPGTSTTFEEVLVLARLYRTALEHLGVRGGPKVTGQRGVQIWVPVSPRHTFDQTRRWVEAVSRSVASTVPDLVSWEWRTDDRGGLARLDYTQNAHHKTLVAPWSVRPAPGAPVSVPIDWHELDDPGLTPDRWNVSSVVARVRERGDPLAPLVGLPQELPRF